jgi:transcriptional regulator with XRE-family HTH domain
MSFKSIRDQRHLSQEKIADMSGLSLRTIQRLEAGHRVSYASLRALAVPLAMDVDLLERELYAVETSTDDFVEIPRLVRLLNAWPFARPRLAQGQVQLVEVLCVALAAVVFMASFLLNSDPAVSAVRTGAAIAFAAGYFTSVFVRILDRYKLWPPSAASQETHSK